MLLVAGLALLAAGGAVLAAVNWIGSPEGTTAFRVTLVVLAVTYAALATRVPAGRHRDVVVDAAGVGVLGIAALTGGLLFFALLTSRQEELRAPER